MDPRESAALESALEYAARSYPTEGLPLPVNPSFSIRARARRTMKRPWAAKWRKHAPGGRWKPAVVPEIFRNPKGASASATTAAPRKRCAQAREGRRRERAEEKAERDAQKKALVQKGVSRPKATTTRRRSAVGAVREAPPRRGRREGRPTPGAQTQKEREARED